MKSLPLSITAYYRQLTSPTGSGGIARRRKDRFDTAANHFA